MLSYNYVDSLNPNLICCICRVPFIDPVTTRSCSHTFCRDCISEALVHCRQCPVDRLALTVDDLEQADPIIRSLVDELMVWCPIQGCTYLCQRHLLQGHLNEGCEYKLVPCPDQSCSEQTMRKDIVDGRCTHTPVFCNDCESELPESLYEEHVSICLDSSCICEYCSAEMKRSLRKSHNEICQRASVVCVHSSHGCAWSGERRLLDVHISSCSYEAIKGFLTIHSQSTQALKEENNLLRAKVDALQGHLRLTNRELQAAKAALGPWYVNATARPSSELPLHAQHHAATTSTNRLSRRSSVSMPSDPLDEFAAYFPPDDLPTHTPGPSNPQDWRGVPPRTSPNISQNWDPSSLTARSVARDVVAPIDLSASLEGSLNGLRESLVTLSTTMDSLGRRNEIALTNESLRLNEEVMSLRAHMHGLRMQVHAIMMDRNARFTGRVDETSVDGTWIPSRFSQVPGPPPPLSVTKL